MILPKQPKWRKDFKKKDFKKDLFVPIINILHFDYT